MKPFVMIEVELFSQLDPYEYVVYAWIKHRSGKNGKCWESQENMVRHLKLGLTSLKKSIKSLLAKKILKVETRRGRTDLYSMADLTEPSRLATTEPSRETTTNKIPLDLEKEITNSLISNAGEEDEKSADAESLISEEQEPEPEPEHAQPLASIPPANSLPRKHPDPSQGIAPPPPPCSIKIDSTKDAFGKERPIVRQKRQATADNLYLQGLKNPVRRWKDFDDYLKFEAYATEWAENRRKDLEKNPDGTKYGSGYVRTILSRTATTRNENDSNLLCWKSWNLEISPPPLVQWEPEPEREKWDKDGLARIEAWLAASKLATAEYQRKKAQAYA